MKYEELLPLLYNYSKIIVTGPQRSGTTITGKIIAHDLGYNYIDESKDLIGVTFENLERFLSSNSNVVVQCPILACYAHKIDEISDNIAIIYMIRDTDDIYESQKRIEWNWCETEKNAIRKMLEKYNLNIKLDFDKQVAVVKYQLWNNYQKERMTNAFELYYESLRHHDMWVDKSLRAEFDMKQTEIE